MSEGDRRQRRDDRHGERGRRPTGGRHGERGRRQRRGGRHGERGRRPTGGRHEERGRRRRGGHHLRALRTGEACRDGQRTDAGTGGGHQSWDGRPGARAHHDQRSAPLRRGDAGRDDPPLLQRVGGREDGRCRLRGERVDGCRRGGVRGGRDDRRPLHGGADGLRCPREADGSHVPRPRAERSWDDRRTGDRLPSGWADRRLRSCASGAARRDDPDDPRTDVTDVDGPRRGFRRFCNRR